MSTATLSLNDLIGLHYKQVDVAHRFWSYMWLAGAAAITASASVNSLADTLKIGYLPFAMANMFLIFSAQKQVTLSAKAIRAIAEENAATMPANLSIVIVHLRPWSPWLVTSLHALLTAFVLSVLQQHGA